MLISGFYIYLIKMENQYHCLELLSEYFEVTVFYFYQRRITYHFLRINFLKNFWCTVTLKVRLMFSLLLILDYNTYPPYWT